MTGFAHDIAGGQGNLVAIVEKSPNYVPGASGWAIFKNGNVEFNSGTFRGTVTAGTFAGTDFVINSDGEFFYSGAPAFGNLASSKATTSGTDGFGNAYIGGDVEYASVGLSGYVAMQLTADGLRAYASPGGAGGPYGQVGQVTLNATRAFLNAPSWSVGGPVTVPLIAVDPVAGGITPETWHAVTYAGTWGTAGSDVLKYRLMPDDSTWIHGRVSNTANQVSGSTIATLPAGYFDTTRTTWGTCSIANASTVMPMQVLTSGALQILSSYALGTALIVNMRIPLDIT